MIQQSLSICHYILVILNSQCNFHFIYSYSYHIFILFMLSPENTKLRPIVSLELQTRLVDAWSQNCIPEFYQTIFLRYIKHIPAEEAELIMKEEIKIIRKGNSYIQLFLKSMRDKAKIEDFMAPGTAVEPDLPRLCGCLGKLRELNYKAAHLLHSIRDKYDEENKVKSERYFFHRFATRLDQFRKTLFKSKLNRIVTWQADYDPFYMGLKLQEKSNQEQGKALGDFFSIAVDDSYRFLKMRKVLVSWIYMDNCSKEKCPPSPPLEEKYIVFPSIKNELMKERSADLRRLKTIPVYQDEDAFKRSHSRINSDVDTREKDSNRTRYLRSRGENLRTGNRNQPQLLGKNVQQNNHLNNFASAPFQLPYRNQRRSEEIGKIRRSRVSQFNNNIISQGSKPRYAKSTGKSFIYNTKMERLETYPITPQRSQSRYQANMQSSSSRMLTKSLMVNIMISPVKPQTQKQPQNTQEAPRQMISSNIPERPIQAQPRRSTAQSMDFGLQDSAICAARIETTAKNNNRSKNPYQSQVSEYKSNPQLTKRNSVPIVRENNDGMRSTIIMVREENVLNSHSNGHNSIRQTNNTNIHQNNPITSNPNSNYPNDMPNYLNNQQKNVQSSQNPVKTEPIQQTILTKSPQQNINTLNPISNQPNNANIIKPQSTIPATVFNTNANSHNNNNYNQNPSTTINTNSSIPLNTKTSTDQNTNNNPNQTQNVYTNSYRNQSTIQPQYQTNQNTNTNPNVNTDTNQKNYTNQNPLINPLSNSKSDAITNPALNSNTIPNYKQNTNNFQSEHKKTVAKQQKREIKIKICKFTFNSLVEYVSSYSAHPQYSKLYDLKKILKETELQQSYIIQFLINDGPGALALSSLVPPLNNFAIRLWLLHSTADLSLSSILFKKYVQLVQKYITAPIIYFKGEEIRELADSGFQQKKQKLYSRQRTSKPREIQRQFEPFLNCECSQVSFPQKQKEDVLYSQQIQKFDARNSLAADFMFNMQGISGPLVSIVKVNRGLTGFVQVNKLLSQDSIDEYQVNKSITASPIDLLRIGYQSTIKDPFTACEGVFKFFGFEVMVQAQRSIYVVNVCKNNGKMYFGKGFQTIQQFAMSNGVDNGKRANVCVPMFSKSLYGRYSKVRQNQKGFYGNWDFSLVWEDEMQGRVKHSTENSVLLSCPFFVGLQLQGILIYSLQISKDDLLY